MAKTAVLWCADAHAQRCIVAISFVEKASDERPENEPLGNLK